MRTQITFSRWWNQSARQKWLTLYLSITESRFVTSINRNMKLLVLLQFLPNIRQISSGFFIFQQDSSPRTGRLRQSTFPLTLPNDELVMVARILLLQARRTYITFYSFTLGACGHVYRLQLPQTGTYVDEIWNISDGTWCALIQEKMGDIAPGVPPQGAKTCCFFSVINATRPFGQLTCTDFDHFWNNRRESLSTCVHRWKFSEFLRRGSSTSAKKQPKIWYCCRAVCVCATTSSNGTIPGDRNHLGSHVYWGYTRVYAVYQPPVYFYRRISLLTSVVIYEQGIRGLYAVQGGIFPNYPT